MPRGAVITTLTTEQVHRDPTFQLADYGFQNQRCASEQAQEQQKLQKVRSLRSRAGCVSAEKHDAGARFPAVSGGAARSPVPVLSGGLGLSRSTGE